MQIFYMLKDCGMREEVLQLFCVNVNQKQEDESFKLEACIGAVTANNMTLLFRKRDREYTGTLEEINALLNSTVADHFDLAEDWDLFQIVPIEEFERMRAEGPGPIEEESEPVEDDGSVEIEEDGRGDDDIEEESSND